MVVAELTEAQLLSVWESGSGQGPRGRALLLARTAAGDAEPVADLTLAALHALLLGFRERAFGSSLPCAADCPVCKEPLEVAVESEELRPSAPAAVPGARTAPPTGSFRADGCDVTYRALTLRDLLAVANGGRDVRRALLQRCVVSATPDAGSLPGNVLEEVARRLPGIDPGAETTVALECPGCGHAWSAEVDVAGHLWAEIEGYARRLLYEVHALARAYGWTEQDVLAVSPARRRFYLEAAG
ncbi:hypothetical protein [Streptomyces telluris]|uniref:Phage baseplate protein n=1 Tax=Streptomyces telluris TaxID=2720021 RepID=A0A9X2LHT8_9ACTN|nr:hypothetical protein [Streptomyces telluris]MCQ8771572.1 hypothetical protein [Streptomyces telluris]NJP79427.1 hypothetical protein [Streptomyces telluris]